MEKEKKNEQSFTLSVRNKMLAMTLEANNLCCRQDHTFLVMNSFWEFNSNANTQAEGKLLIYEHLST